MSAALEQRYWPDGSALGKRVASFAGSGTIAGVVDDVRTYRLEEPPEQMITCR